MPKWNFLFFLIWGDLRFSLKFAFFEEIRGDLRRNFKSEEAWQPCQPNIKFTVEEQINHSIAFLDVFISGINNQNFKLQTHHKSTYTGFLLSFKSFTLFSYKISWIKFLIDRSFKICNNWNSFHNDIESIKSDIIKNAYPQFLIDKVIKKYLNYKFSSKQNQLKDTSGTYYFKLQNISNLSYQFKSKL